MAGETEVGLRIKAREEAVAQIAKTRAEMDKLAQEISKMRKEALLGADNSKKLGEAIVKQSELAKNLAKSIKEASSSTRILATAQEDMVASIASSAGPIGGVATRLGLLGTAAGVTAVGVAALGVAILAATRGIADYQERIDQAADSTGLTTGQIAGMKVAAAEAGKSFEQILPGLESFTGKVGSAADGNEQAIRTFTELGIGVKNAAGEIRPTGDILREVQDKLSDIEAPAERARIGFELFGKQGRSALNVLLTPLDEAEAKARKLGIALGPDGERVARQADRAFDSLSTALQGMANAFGVVAAKIAGPFLTELAKAASAVARFVNSKEFQLFLHLGRPGGTAGLQPPEGYPATPAGAEGATQGELPKPGVVEPIVDKEAESFKKAVAEVEKLVELGAISHDEALSRLSILAKQTEETKRQAEAWAAFTKILAEQNVLLEERQGLQGAGPLPAAGFESPDIKEELGLKKVLDPEDANSWAEAVRVAESGMKNLELRLRETTAEVKALAEAEKEKAILEHALVSTLKREFISFVEDAIDGVADLGASFHDFVKAIIKLTANIVLGGVLPFQTGGTPVKAQTGLVVEGIRGVDRVPALLGRGETVIDHSTTDALRNLVPKLAAFVDSFSRTGPVSVGAGEKVTYVTPITFTVNSHTTDIKELRSFVEEELASVVDRSRQSNSFRRR